MKNGKDIRAEVGKQNLDRNHKKTVLENSKALKKTLAYFKENKLPLIITEVAEKSGISVPTLYRKPYCEMINEYRVEEKVLFSPKGKQEIASMIREIDMLKNEVKVWKEKYTRLKKEITYSRELFE
jgi:DNA invertase Pin-like site-specific DNA recombinase